MPSDQENMQYLYLVLTHGGPPTIDWDPICAALNLKKEAATKRWSRLKLALETGDKPTRTNFDFLWLLVKHSSRTKALDWAAIAEQCNSTKVACAKRYSRLKIAFERGDEAPRAGCVGEAAPSAPTKAGRDAGTTPKRRRAAVQGQRGESAAEDADDDVDEVVDRRVKRAKLATGGKAKMKPKPKNGFKARAHTETVDGEDGLETAPAIKNEEDDEPNSAIANEFEADNKAEVFVDAAETLGFDEWV
ncbi:hypothetical protein EJ07DRAFT_163334 [Lizonia empirigonia]|nr:hypothetical protein EJ07DRAFT_163334 [Lizonia empirigonia]